MIAFYCTDCCFCYICDIGIKRILYVYSFVPVLCAHIRHSELRFFFFFFCFGPWVFDKQMNPCSLQALLSVGGGGRECSAGLQLSRILSQNFLQDDCTVIAYDHDGFLHCLT